MLSGIGVRSKFGFLANNDNGGGFYDYNRYYAGEELRYHSPGWNLKSGRAH